ncbi:MAG TPA: histidine kinase dimerization/phospho-acceptor domain-containing protein [Solirubrobacteraceae bacterium]|jgi:K+-sensing histidine kinase KdpD|nr:histidine kinase dimerization/phospho-acceptor domain-containing protein [Solirubrobacteraceae bacterium]
MPDAPDADARLAKLVHDLRSPLTVAEGFAQLLARDEGTLTAEQRTEFASRVASAMADMRALLDAAR